MGTEQHVRSLSDYERQLKQMQKALRKLVKANKRTEKEVRKFYYAMMRRKPLLHNGKKPR